MEKIKERTGQYEVAVRSKSNGYFEARISFKLGGGKSPRLQNGGKSEKLAVLSLLIALSSYIETSFKNGEITTKIDDIVPQRLLKSINDLELATPEITAKSLEIVNKINYINSTILNTISIPSNILPFPPQATIQNAVVPIPTIAINNVNTNVENTNVSSNNNEPCIIEDLADEWLKYRLSLCKKTEDNPKPLSQKTVDSNHQKLKDIILPYFKKNKKVYLSQVTEECVKSLIKSIKSQHSKNKCYIVLNMLFKYAIKNNKATSNPLENIDKPPEKIKTGEENEEMDFIEPDEQDKWVDMFEKENTDMSLLFETMLLTGIRPEEACGLKWKALDLENNELIINNAYKEFNVYDENMVIIGHKRGDDKLKTPESYRRIPLNPILREMLIEHKLKQQALFKKSRAIKDRHRKWSENEYIFLGRNYHPYVSATLTHGIEKICDKYNVQRITPYGLRHSFATYCSEHGMEEIVLMKLMRTF